MQSKLKKLPRSGAATTVAISKLPDGDEVLTLHGSDGAAAAHHSTSECSALQGSLAKQYTAGPRQTRAWVRLGLGRHDAETLPLPRLDDIFVGFFSLIGALLGNAGECGGEDSRKSCRTVYSHND